MSGDLEDRVPDLAARRDDRDRVADLATQERGAHRRDARDPPLAGVRLRRRHDLEHGLLAALLDPYARAQLDDRPALGGRDHDDVLELRLERADPALEEPLLLARR